MNPAVLLKVGIAAGVLWWLARKSEGKKPLPANSCEGIQDNGDTKCGDDLFDLFGKYRCWQGRCTEMGIWKSIPVDFGELIDDAANAASEWIDTGPITSTNDPRLGAQ